MKKFLLIVFALGIFFPGFSQTRKSTSGVDRNVSRTAVYKGSLDEAPAIVKPINMFVEKPLSFNEIQLGTTIFDNQSNSSVSNRFYRHQDGTMAFVWSMGMIQAGTWPDRGTGYNYFDGSSWGAEPTARLESQRVGWPSYAPLGANGEVIITHKATDLVMSKRATKGTGTWIQSNIDGPGAGTKLTWPRICTSGTDHNTIHLLANTYEPYNGQGSALLYYRSQDGGTSWDISATAIPGTGSDNYFQVDADSYVWAEPRANTLAFVIGNSWCDFNLFKSTDNGDTWTKTLIWANPYPLFDWNTTITTDTIRCPESVSCALDNTGKAHVVFGLGRVTHEAVGNNFNYWPYTDGIGYWNEDMPPFTAVNQNHALDSDTLYAKGNLVGWSLDLDGNGFIWDFADLYAYNPQVGISTMPQLSIDAANNMFLAYSSTAEGFVGDQYNYKHIFLRYGTPGGSEWQNFIHVNDDPAQIFDEAIFPQLTANSDDNLHLVYNVDEQPGTLLGEDPGHLANQNRQLYSMVPKFLLGVGIPENSDFVNVKVSPNYPNPFRNTSQVEVSLAKTAPVSIRVSSLTGLEMSYVNYGLQAAGPHVYKIDGTDLCSGVYFYTVIIGKQQYVQKMIVK